MTISQSLTAWLSGYADEPISTDFLKSESVSMGMFKAPNQIVRENILGVQSITDFFTVRFRFDSSMNSERISNQEWLEGLQEWITARNAAHDFPVISAGTCLEVTVSSPFYVETAEQDTNVYQMSLSVTYRKD